MISLVVGSFSLDALMASCSGMRFLNRYQLTPKIAPVTGIDHVPPAKE
jgi:hypothetical protein